MLNVVTSNEAVETLKTLLGTASETEHLPLCRIQGRVLSEAIVSPYNIPAFDRSTVDGYAVCASDTYGSSESMPAILTIGGRIPMGVPASCRVTKGVCCEIATGAMMPEGADAVVMVEYTEEDGDECLVMKAASPLQNVTKKGDDVKENETVFEKGQVLSPVEIGILASLGRSSVPVFRTLSVGILSTGDEIIAPGSELCPGKVFDSNAYIVASLLEKYGCRTQNYGIIPDDYEALRSAVERAALENDLVLLSGGSSAGRKDMTARVIEELGELYIHGIAMKPGKPTVIGTANGKTIVGLPGHPAAAFFVCETILRPAVAQYYFMKEKRRTLLCEVDCNISSNHGREEIIPVKVSGKTATPIFAKSGILSNIASSDGFIRIDRNLEGLKQGDSVTVTLY